MKKVREKTHNNNFFLSYYKKTLKNFEEREEQINKRKIIHDT